MIIYFTATGNSRYIAEAVADRLGDRVLCANDLIKRGEKGDFDSDKPYIFVFPVYVDIAPALFRDFIRASKFRGSRDAYFIATCAKTGGSVPNACREVCAQTGCLNYRGSTRIGMPQNYLLMFRMFDDEERERCYRGAIETVDNVCAKIEAGATLEDKFVSNVGYIATKGVEWWFNKRFTRTWPFKATDACIGCGLCAKSCPTNTIEMKDGRPVWVNKLCVHCMACINLCPKGAIEYGKKTQGKLRHRCPRYTPKA